LTRNRPLRFRRKKTSHQSNLRGRSEQRGKKAPGKTKKKLNGKHQFSRVGRARQDCNFKNTWSKKKGRDAKKNKNEEEKGRR